MPNYVIDRLASGEPEEACNEFDGVVNKAEDTPEPPNKIGGAAVSSLLDIMLEVIPVIKQIAVWSVPKTSYVNSNLSIKGGY